MKYQTVSYIRSMVQALSVESHSYTLYAACRERVDHNDEWEVLLFSKHELWKEYLDLVVLAQALLKFLPHCTIYTTRYNSAPQGEEYHDAIVLW